MTSCMLHLFSKVQSVLCITASASVFLYRINSSTDFRDMFLISGCYFTLISAAEVADLNCKKVEAC